MSSSLPHLVNFTVYDVLLNCAQHMCLIELTHSVLNFFRYGAFASWIHSYRIEQIIGRLIFYASIDSEYWFWDMISSCIAEIGLLWRQTWWRIYRNWVLQGPQLRWQAASHGKINSFTLKFNQNFGSTYLWLWVLDILVHFGF